MSQIKIAGKLPKHVDGNGLTDDNFLRFLREPQTPQLVIAVLQTSKITKDIENHDTVPTVAIRAIEAFTGGDELGRLRAMLQRRHADRTGHLELPGQWEEVLASMASPKLPGTER